MRITYHSGAFTYPFMSLKKQYGLHILGVCLLALVIQNAERKRRIILSVASLAVQNFSTLYHKRHDLKKKKKYSLIQKDGHRQPICSNW